MKPLFKISGFAITLTASLLIPDASYADLYRYQNDNGDIIMTTEPRRGLKLLEVIRDRNANPPAAKTASSQKDTSLSSNNQNQAQRESQFDAFITEAADLYGIPAAFIRAVIKIESNFNPRAVSRVGAMGLMQLMPATAAHMNVGDPFDPRDNILGGTRYLRRLSDRYDGDINLVLSGYHAGPGNVERVGGIPFEKTQQYVRNVYSWYVRYRQKADKSASGSSL